jgi:Na+-translocating ferredoxin:NAD+ oxidoreductase subunit A
MSSLLLILLSAMLVNLVAITHGGKWRPFSNAADIYTNAMGMARAHAIAVPASAVLCWVISANALAPLGLNYLRTPAFVAVVLVIVPCTEILLRRTSDLIPARPAFATLLSTSSVVLGVALVSEERASNLFAAFSLAVLGAFVFALLLLAAATLYERLRYADVPAPFRDAPIVLITAGLMALGFMGFTGLIQE